MPGLWQGFLAVVKRDLLLAWKRPGDILNPLFFFAMVCTLFPLAVGPSSAQLSFSGPGVVWVAALLATLLSLNSLFLSDFEDGSLDQLILSPQPLPLLALGKTVAHWLSAGLPLVLVSPLVAVNVPPSRSVDNFQTDAKAGTVGRTVPVPSTRMGSEREAIICVTTDGAMRGATTRSG